MADTSCQCLQGAFIDLESMFAIKTMKDFLRDVDFTTYFEKGRLPSSENCDDICSVKGQSITMVNSEEDLIATVNVYKELFPFSPKYKSHYTLVRLKEDSGLIKLTPTENNPLHHDFYKSDEFTLEKINFISSTPLSDV